MLHTVKLRTKTYVFSAIFVVQLQSMSQQFAVVNGFAWSSVSVNHPLQHSAIPNSKKGYGRKARRNGY